MDLWLLGQHQELVAMWAPPHRHSSLNALERVLVAAAAGPPHLARCAADMTAACRQASKDRCSLTDCQTPAQTKQMCRHPPHV